MHYFNLKSYKNLLRPTFIEIYVKNCKMYKFYSFLLFVLQIQLFHKNLSPQIHNKFDSTLNRPINFEQKLTTHVHVKTINDSTRKHSFFSRRKLFFFNPRHLPKCLCIKSSQVVEEFELKGKLTRKRTTWQYYFYLLPTNNSSWQLS